MKVHIQITPDLPEASIVIHTPSLTPAIQLLASSLEESCSPYLPAKQEEKTFLLEPASIHLVRTEADQLVLYDKDKQRYTLAKPLYEIEKQLGTGFVRISKSSLIQIGAIHHVSPTLTNGMRVVLKNGCEDYISRHYFPHFKKQIHL